MKLALRHQEIADDLRRKITAGEYALGKRLPSEAALSEAYEAGRPTLRDALDVLRAEGLLAKRHGSGNYVTRPQPPVRYFPTAYPGESDAVARSPLRTSVSAMSVRAGHEFALLMGVSPNAWLVKYTYANHEGVTPHSLVHVHVPQTVAERDLREIRMVHSPWGEDVRNLLAKAGVRLTVTEERLTARLATAEEAQLLQITTRTPVMAIERVATDAKGRVVEVTRLVLRGERTAVVVTMPTANRGGEVPGEGSTD